MVEPAEDKKWMRLALEQAKLAGQRGEVPIGALLVDEQGCLLAAAGNSPIASQDPSAHAEMLVLRQAGSVVGNYRLPQTTLYVTLEPCVMCAGALVLARVKRVVYGATDPKAGALDSCYQVGQDKLLNHGLDVTSGVMAEECSQLLKDFFRHRRQQAKAENL